MSLWLPRTLFFIARLHSSNVWCCLYFGKQFDASHKVISIIQKELYEHGQMRSLTIKAKISCDLCIVYYYYYY